MDVLKLSDHFSLQEAIHSDTAIAQNLDNTPSQAIIQVMMQASFRMEKIRAALNNKAITINSWYRAPEVNAAVGSKPTSQHLKGEAIDFVCPTFGAPISICKKLIELKDLIRFDQLILEHTWVHISFAISTGKPRYQVLSLLRSGGYSTGLTDRQGHSL